jgi:hypothetical protein
MWDSLDGTTQYPSRFSFPFPREAKHIETTVPVSFSLCSGLWRGRFAYYALSATLRWLQLSPTRERLFLRTKRTKQKPELRDAYFDHLTDASLWLRYPCHLCVPLPAESARFLEVHPLNLQSARLLLPLSSADSGGDYSLESPV